MSGPDTFEKKVMATLQKYCDYGWGYHYILREKFGEIVAELKEFVQSKQEVSDLELVRFLLKTRACSSEQERAEKLTKEFIVIKREQRN